MKNTLSDNLVSLRGAIAEACERYDRDADDITVVAVTKTHPAATIQRAVALGLFDIGESKVQEAETKIAELGHIARYHLVGHLQSNKVKKAVELFDVIQSVDSLKLAEEINRRAAEIDREIECLIEINSSGETQKYGVQPGDALPLVDAILPLASIKLTGFMTVGPLTDDEDKVRESFRLCHTLFHKAQRSAGDQFRVLSMGMSGDYRLAIAEGTTMLRIGSSLFGPRVDRVKADTE